MSGSFPHQPNPNNRPPNYSQLPRQSNQITVNRMQQKQKLKSILGTLNSHSDLITLKSIFQTLNTYNQNKFIKHLSNENKIKSVMNTLNEINYSKASNNKKRQFLYDILKILDNHHPSKLKSIKTTGDIKSILNQINSQESIADIHKRVQETYKKHIRGSVKKMKYVNEMLKERRIAENYNDYITKINNYLKYNI